MKKVFVATIRGFVIVFAIIGFILSAGYLAVYFNLTATEGIVDEQTENFLRTQKNDAGYTVFPIAHTKEWLAFKQAVVKDKPTIEKIAKETGISPRLLIAILVPEQMRLFYSNRDVFKTVFGPLKILGSQSQFSWGIFGIKDETARAVEANLVNQKSPFYPGKKYEHLLDFATDDIDQERFARIIDEHDHTYSYRYTALYILQIQAQWAKAGYPLVDQPGIIATLWNLGFHKSIPNKNPQSGGSSIEINGKTYSFGAFANDFYYSDELIELFPKE
jgi:hypothetical protein